MNATATHLDDEYKARRVTWAVMPHSDGNFQFAAFPAIPLEHGSEQIEGFL